MTLRYMLGTDTVIRGCSHALDARLRDHDRSTLCISAITRAELQFGIARRPKAQALAAQVALFLEAIVSVPWDDGAADCYGVVRARLESAGMPIGNLDTMILAHALSSETVLVTNNERHFRIVDGLTIENWLRNGG